MSACLLCGSADFAAVFRGSDRLYHTTAKEFAVVRCGKCRAPVPPVDLSSASCPFCGATVALPDEVRLRVRNSTQASLDAPRNEKTIRNLLNQPGAPTANAAMAL